MAASLDPLFRAILSGPLPGGYYASVSVGVSISFGMLDVVNITHPDFTCLVPTPLS